MSAFSSPIPLRLRQSNVFLLFSAQVNPVSSPADKGRHHRHHGGPAVSRQRKVPERRHHRLLPQVRSRSSLPAVSRGCFFVMDAALWTRYLLLNTPSALSERCHVFSSFFYKQLTRRDNASEGSNSDAWVHKVQEGNAQEMMFLYKNGAFWVTENERWDMFWKLKTTLLFRSKLWQSCRTGQAERITVTKEFHLKTHNLRSLKVSILLLFMVEYKQTSLVSQLTFFLS